jgi:hypothetical protein
MQFKYTSKQGGYRLARQGERPAAVRIEGRVRHLRDGAATMQASRTFLCALLGMVLLIGGAGASAMAAGQTRWYETRSVAFDANTIAGWSEGSYWSARLRKQADVVLYESELEPGEQSDALTAAISTWLAGTPSRERGEWAFRLNPGPASPSAVGASVRVEWTEARPRLSLAPFLFDEHVALGAEDEADSGWSMRMPISHAAFPGGMRAFCDSNAAVCSVLFQALEQRVRQPGRRLVTVSNRDRHFSFHASIGSPADPARGATVRYLGETPMIDLAPPPGFANKDPIDTWLEGLQAGGEKDPLGQLIGFDRLQGGERVAMKYATGAYFQSGTRDAEARVALPASASEAQPLYTLRLLPGNNDVSVEPLGHHALTRCDLRWTPGFPVKANAGAMREWLLQRYPAIKPSGETPQALVRSAQRLIDAHAGTRKWFALNYRIAVLDPKAAYRRLVDAHGFEPERLDGLKAFEADELHVLECVLESMTDRLLQRARDSVLVRQDAPAVDAQMSDLSGSVLIAGHTLSRIITFKGQPERREVHSTIAIYDVALRSPARFVGGRAPDGRVHVYAPLAEVLAHEFGHVLAQRASIGDRFNRWAAKEGVEPFTRYAASAPATEFLPEAFALYLLDPSWLRSSYPALYKLIDEYSRRPPLH